MGQVGFILKVIAISVGLSALIKYSSPVVSIPATTINVLAIVLMPTLILAIALWWRTSNQQIN